MYNLTNFTENDVSKCGEALAGLGAGASSMEEAAGRVVRYLYDNLSDGSGSRACVLARFYKTHPYGALSSDLQEFARGILGRAPASGDMKCLTLLGTVGDKREWSSRDTSSGHKAIPLPSEDFVSRIPMISRLLSQFGLNVNAVIRPDPALLADLEHTTYNAFHVPEAVGSPYIPAQKEFVIPHGVRSALGFGGVLAGGDLFAVILFSKAAIPRKTADNVKALALKVKEAAQPFAANVFSETASSVSGRK